MSENPAGISEVADAVGPEPEHPKGPVPRYLDEKAQRDQEVTPDDDEGTLGDDERAGAGRDPDAHDPEPEPEEEGA